MSETSATPLSRKLILAAYGCAPSTARGDRLATAAAAAAPRLEACTVAAAAVVAGELSGEWSHASEAPASSRLPGTGAVTAGATPPLGSPLGSSIGSPLGEGALALSKRREGEEDEQAVEGEGKRAAEAAEAAVVEAAEATGPLTSRCAGGPSRLSIPCACTATARSTAERSSRTRKTPTPCGAAGFGSVPAVEYAISGSPAGAEGRGVSD